MSIWWEGAVWVSLAFFIWVMTLISDYEKRNPEPLVYRVFLEEEEDKEQEDQEDESFDGGSGHFGSVHDDEDNEKQQDDNDQQ